MLFPLLSLSLIALSPTFYESFANANSATFVNLINFTVYRNECTVASSSSSFFIARFSVRVAGAVAQD